MRKTLEFYFDVGSPTAYLAHCRLRQLRAQYDFDLQYRPMLLGGVFKATGNTSPVAIPAKGKYMLEQDLPRFTRRYGVPLNFNPHFPVNTLYLMRAAIAAQHEGCFDAYIDAVMTAMWVERKAMGDLDVVREVLAAAGLDADTLLAAATLETVKSELLTRTEEAIGRGVFGAPTLFMDGAMYFGQDRLDFIEEALRAS